jgi:hypothetical protein
MWEPRRLKTLWPSTVFYKDSFTFFYIDSEDLHYTTLLNLPLLLSLLVLIVSAAPVLKQYLALLQFILEILGLKLGPQIGYHG